MIKLPARRDGQWTVTHSSDKLPDLSATRNLTFDKEGYLRLSKPVISFYSESDDVDFDVPVGFFQANNDGKYHILTNEATFYLDMYNSGNFGTFTVAQSTATDAPENTSSSTRSDVVQFNQTINYLNPTDRNLYWLDDFQAETVAWTKVDLSASLEASSDLNVCSFKNQNTLAVGNDNQVDQYNTSYAAGTQLQLPNDYSITGVTYSNGYLGVTTHAKNNFSNSLFCVWDGNTTEANYIVEVPATTCYSPTPYRGSFVFLDGNGILWYWTPGGLQILASLPSYYSSATFSLGKPNNNKNHSVMTDGELIHINVKSFHTSSTENGDYFNANQPAGIWTYDPAVGLYHRHAPTGTKVVVDTVATADVNTSTDAITVTTAPETGTPVRYSDAGGTAIAGLTNRKVYYTIKVDATTIKLAETLTLAEAGTAIDLTGTGNANQTLQFYKKTDFGNTYAVGQQGAVYIEREKDQANDLYYQDFFYGAKCAINTTTEYAVGGCTLQDTENRGHFITAKFMSQQLQDDWQKGYIKHSELVSDLDKIVIKYRIDNNEPLTRIKESADGTITWSDSDTFTTTDTQWANVQAGDEVEIIQGTGSGYLLHISSISESGGTYTVNLDEGVKNLTASDTGRAIASRWKKLTTITKDNPRNSDGYSEFPVGIKSKQIQFKVELRGEDVEIEEMLVANELSKPA